MKKVFEIVLVLVFFLSFALFAFGQSQTQWPTFQANSARTGFSASDMPSELKILWQWTVGDFKKLGVSDCKVNKIIIDNDEVFFSALEVFALDLETGKEIWRYKDEGADFYPGGLTAGDRKIFIVVNDSLLMKTMFRGSVYALDEATGKFLWKYQVQKPISHSLPLFMEGKVFIGDDSGTLYALDAETGGLAWQVALDAEEIHSSPAFDKGVIFVGTEGTGRSNELPSYVYALNAIDGSMVWRFQVDYIPGKLSLVHSTPAISEDVVYIGSENGYFYALSSNDGAMVWRKKIASGEDRLVGTSAPAALGHEKVFARIWEGKLLALNQEDGSVLWEYNFGEGGGDIPAMVANDKVCIGYQEYFYCFGEENGKIAWKEKLGVSSPVLASGILVVANAAVADGSSDQTPVITAFSETKEIEEREEIQAELPVELPATQPDDESQPSPTSAQQTTQPEESVAQAPNGEKKALSDEEESAQEEEESVQESKFMLILTIIIVVCSLIFIGYWFFRLRKKL